MKLFLRCSLVPLLLLSNSCATLFPSRNYDEAINRLQKSIDAILEDSIFVSAHAGIKIVSLTDERVLYERDSKVLFHPASNLKLLTSAATLHALGTNYKFRTALYLDSLNADGTVVGNLFIKGFGNPDLTMKDLKSMIEQLRTGGVRKVQGGIVCDVSYFDDLYWGKGWMWDDEPSFYEAFISPLSINDNCVRVIVGPGKRIGDSVLVRLDPESKFLAIVNKGFTGADTSENTLDVSREFKIRMNTIVVEGTLPHSSREREFVLSVWHPEVYAAALLREELERQGVKVLGQTRMGIVDTQAREVVLHEWPIDSVIINLNKTSDNLSAENLLKVVGAEKRGTPGSAAKGISVVNEFLSSSGIDTTSYLMVDGSGVSHYNLINADTYARLLSAVYRHKGIFDLFYTSLPIAGVDGTLQNRMKETAAAGKVRAKTGTISGVSTLSGYAQTADGDTLAFSILMDHFTGSSKPYRDAQDKIAELLSRFSRYLALRN